MIVSQAAVKLALCDRNSVDAKDVAQRAEQQCVTKQEQPTL